MSEHKPPSRWRWALTNNLPMGFISVAEGLVLIATLGYCPQAWNFKWAAWRTRREIAKRQQAAQSGGNEQPDE